MATIKISDLSVGDLIHHDFYEVDMRVVNINGEAKRIIAESSSGHGVTCHLDHFSPIPITPEILEANGWKRNEEDEYMEYYGDPTCSITHTKGTHHYRLEAPEVSVVCYYVHQLQHALRLAGVDKEIVMPKK